MEDKKEDFQFSKKEIQFLIVSFFVCVILSLIFLIFARHLFIHKSSQDIATTVSGVLGTALVFFGSVLVYMAFKEQVNANKLIQKQFKIQMFESRFYKMLDIYNLNVSDLKFINRKTGNHFEGKMVFSQMITNYNKLQKEILEFNKIKKYAIDDILNSEYKIKFYQFEKHSNIGNWAVLELSYIIFFYGVGVTGRKNIYSLLFEKYKKEYLKQLLNYLSNKPVEHTSNIVAKEDWKKIKISTKNFDRPNSKNFDKYYNGHQSNLGHYYRHIFMIINFINDQEMFAYLEKWQYSKLLRTQLSNHEQELFFLNSISVLGRDWELKHTVLEDKNENKGFITKYDLIRNVSKSVLFKYKIKSFYPNVEYEQEDVTPYRKKLEENVYK